MYDILSNSINVDALIIGKGPAGLQAAIYLARAGFAAAVVGHDAGSLALAEKIENYYGQAEPLSGADLQRIGEAQAQSFGITLYGEQVTGFGFGDDGSYNVNTTAHEFTAKTILMATGAKRAKAPIKGIEAFEGFGVSYCAVCDGFLYRGKEVGVLGSGEYAFSEASELAAIIGRVTIFTNGETPMFGVKPSDLNPDKFEVVSEPVKSLEGNGALTGIRFQNGGLYPLDGLFIAYGTAGSADLAKKLGVLLTERGDVVTDRDQATNVPGVFAAGDCTGVFRQIAVAAGQGAVAARTMIEYMRRK